MRPLLTHIKLFQDAQLDVEREQKTKMKKKIERKRREDRERRGNSRRLCWCRLWLRTEDGQGQTLRKHPL